MNRSVFFTIAFALSRALLAVHLGIPCDDNCVQHQSAVQILSLDKGNHLFRCSGTLIAPDTVITDSSCVYEQKTQQSLRSVLISPKEHVGFRASVEVISIARHETQNLAILFLKEALESQPAILLSPAESSQIRFIDKITLVGFGLTKVEKKNFWTSFLGGDTAIGGFKHIGQSTVHSRTAFEWSISAKHTENTSCQGDEGGPVFGQIDTLSDNSLRLIGIMSKNVNQTNCQAPSSMLSLDRLLDFIDSHLKENCLTKLRTWCEVPGILPPSYFDKQIAESIKEEDLRDPSIDDPLPKTFSENSSHLPKATNHAKAAEPVAVGQGKKSGNVQIENIGCRCTNTNRNR